MQFSSSFIKGASTQSSAHLTDRVILHIDLNSCFASCEQQDTPIWRHKPLGVVQDSGKRGVIIGSSVEAKALGIGTGCAVWEAKRICPEIVLVPAHFERYAHYSRLFRQICFDYSYRVEVFSIDELFLDITKTAHLFARDIFGDLPRQSRANAGRHDPNVIEDGALQVALRLKHRLQTDVGDYLRCSVGIAPNKMLAKLASGSQKPDGLVQIGYADRLAFLDQHPLWHICGIGQRIHARLNRMGIYTIQQLRQVPVDYLTSEFGVLGRVYWHWARGEDGSEVALAGEQPPDKSYGNQMTLPADTQSDKEVMEVLMWLCWQVAARLRDHGMGGRVVWMAVRQGNRWAGGQKAVSVCRTAYDLYRTVQYIYYQKLKWEGPIRFAGVSVGNLTPLSTTPLPLLPKEQKQLQLAEAWDAISRRYGVFTVRPASLVGKRLKQGHVNGFTKKF